MPCVTSTANLTLTLTLTLTVALTLTSTLILCLTPAVTLKVTFNVNSGVFTLLCPTCMQARLYNESLFQSLSACCI